MSDEVPAVIDSPYKLLPTGKPHVSWSEVRSWAECSFRHKVRHVDGIDLGKPSSILYFGTAVHASCEDYAKTLVMKPEIAHALLREAFEKHKGEKSFDDAELTKMLQQATDILADVPTFLDETFPGWKTIAAEHYLYEPLSDTKPHHAFKGYIDLVLTCPNPKQHHNITPLTWILDWKTTNSYWSADKKSDPLVTGQLAGYKHYYMQETKTAHLMKQVRTGFILLKRNAKPGQHCELVTVSVGDVTAARTLKVINNCVSSIQRGIALKNREACRWCDYYKTEYCT